MDLAGGVAVQRYACCCGCGGGCGSCNGENAGARLGVLRIPNPLKHQPSHGQLRGMWGP